MHNLRTLRLILLSLILLVPFAGSAQAARTWVIGVSAISGIKVDYATPRASLPLPATARVTLSNFKTATVTVTWNNGSPSYNPNKAASYTFSGTLAMPSGVTNPLNFKASVKVTVASAPTIKSVSAVPAISVANGTPLSALGLPATVSATLSNGTSTNLAVTWDGGKPAYVPTSSGTYAFTGKLTLPAGVTNPSGLTATAKVTVASATTVKSVSALPAINVANGTPLSSLGLPATVPVTLSNGTGTSLAVTWDGGKPAYASTVAGSYVFTGKLTLPAGVTNPSGLTASATATVAAPATSYIPNGDPNPDTALNSHPGNTIFEFDSLDEWLSDGDVSLSLSSANRLSGAAAIEMTPLAPISLGNGYSYYTAVSARAVGTAMADLRNTELGIYVPDTANIAYMLVRFYTDDTYNHYFENAIGTWELSPGWNRLRRMKDDYYFIDSIGSGVAPSWANMGRMELLVVYANGAKPNVTFDRVAVNTAGRAKLLFTFDDAWQDVLQYGYPILESKGFKATTWAIADASRNVYDGIMSEAELAYLYASGWDIGNHTKNHPDNINLLSDAEIRTEYLDTQNWLLSKGWARGAHHVCYPSGSYNERLVSILKEIGVKSGRTVVHGITPTPVTNVYKLKTVAVGRDTDMAMVYREIDRAIATGSSLFLMLHRVEVNPEPDDGGANYGQIAVSTANLQALVDYADSKVRAGNLDVTTISEWYADYMSR